MTVSASKQQKFVRAERRMASEPQLSILQTQILLGSEVPDWSNYDAIADLKSAFSEGLLTATMLTPAPQHEQSLYSGDINPDRAWWDGAWDAATQDGGEWHAWFFNTGIAVAASAVRDRVARINRGHVLAGERARALGAAPFTWELTQALLWIASRDDSRVERIRANLLRPDTADCRTGVETLEDELAGLAARAGTPGSLKELIQDPWNELASGLHAGEISGFAYYPHIADRPEIAAATFANAQPNLVSKTYGLLPHSVGVTTILFNKTRLKSHWPARSFAGMPGQPSYPVLSMDPPSELTAADYGSGHSPDRPYQKWEEKEMTAAIITYCADTRINDREKAWTDHFRGLEQQTGWTNSDFRRHWAVARDTKEKSGRPRKSAE